jgi:hypothetical protein
MTVAELFTLPVGQALRWPALGLGGVVTGRDGGGVRVRLADGVEIEAYPDDDDLAALAGCLERVGEPAADRPIIIDGPARTADTPQVVGNGGAH